jgi:PIN domain nuclease of toxin-antitoxin system
VRCLIDTRVWLWMQTEPERIRGAASDAIADPGNELLLSAASSWEIAIKYALGRLPLPEEPSTYVPSRLRLSGVEGLAVTHSHALRVAALPQHHRDPFDRLLVAQAQLEDLTIITADAALRAYGVPVLAAAG